MFDPVLFPCQCIFQKVTGKLAAKTAEQHIMFHAALADRASVFPHFYAFSVVFITADTLLFPIIFTVRAVPAAGSYF